MTLRPFSQVLQDGKKIGTTDNKGKFNLTILEGSELVFTTYGYASNKLVVDKNYDNIDLQVELKNQPSDFVLIIILSFFGVLLVHFLDCTLGAGALYSLPYARVTDIDKPLRREYVVIAPESVRILSVSRNQGLKALPV